MEKTSLIADLMELGALLKSGADEKLALEKKKKELEATATTLEEKKFDLESENAKLLEKAQNEGSRFEVLSLNLSQMKKECDVMIEKVHDLATRVDRYISAKRELEADNINIENEFVRMQEKLRITECAQDETVRSLQKIEQVVADKKRTLHNLEQFEVADLDD